MTAINPRPDQKNLANLLLNIIARSDHAYLESPTGTGKTLTMAFTGEASKAAAKVVLAHSIDIVEQLIETFDKYAAQGIIADRSSWFILTWHTFHSRHKAGTLCNLLDGNEPHIVFVDECHIGGSVSQSDKLAFRTIKAVSRKVIWVSATPWRIDESILGTRKDHTAQLTIEQAVRLGLLNATEMVRVDCGLRLRAAISDLETSQSKSYSTLLGQIFEADADDVVEAFEKLDDDLEDTIGRGLRVSDLKKIASHVARLMADLYLDRHRGEKAIFWVPNRNIAKACAKYIQGRIQPGLRAEAIISDRIQSTAEHEYTEAAKASFARSDGDVAVACVVYRLREGFDLPELYLGFDCSWNPTNLRNTVQKLGRLIRTAPEKPKSQYYYAVSVKTIAGTKALDLDDGYIDDIAGALNTTLQNGTFAGEALIEAGALLSMLGDGDPQTATKIALEKTSLSGRDYRLARAPLFDFKEVSDYAVVKSMTIDEAINQGSDERQRKLAERILDRLEFGPRMAIKTAHRQAIRRFFVPGTPLFEQALHDRLERLRPALLAELNGNSPLTYAEKLDAIMESLRAGGPPPGPNTPERILLKKAMWPNHNCYRPEIVAEVATLRPELLPVPKAEKRAAAQANVDRVLRLVRSGEVIGKDDRKRLERWLSKNCSKYRQDAYDVVAVHRPDLLPNQQLKGDKLRKALIGKKRPNPSREADLMALSLGFISARTLPPSRSPDWYRVREWIGKNHSKLDAEERAFIAERWPSLLDPTKAVA